MFAIPTFEREFIADKDSAEMFVAANADGSDILFNVSRTKTTRHEIATRKYQEELDRAEGSSKRTNAVLAMIVAESLLNGWKNVRGEDGVDVPATLENKLKMFEKYPPLLGRVISFANNVKNYKDIVVDDGILDSGEKKTDAKGNSETA